MAVIISSGQPPVPDLREKADKIVREAFEAGRLHGYQQAERELRAQLDGLADEIQASLKQTMQKLIVPTAAKLEEFRRKPEAVEQSEKPAPLAYGAKKTAVRLVMMSAPLPGLKMQMVKDRVRHMHGFDLSPSQVREALRALQVDGDAICIDRTWWRPTAQLLNRNPYENGAPNGEAASAPETGEGATSPIESQRFDL